jgi:3-deoxy-D-manno-octulosonate cytidylyltransferase
MKIIAIIPARYQSSRFPGKPLADILGKPMVWWVYHQAKKSKQINKVYVATDDQRILDVCNNFEIPSIMTSKQHRNGSERLSEVADKIKADIYITIQGDEPLLEPQTIDSVIQVITEEPDTICATLKTPYRNPVDVINATTPKVVTDLKDNILLFTRSAVPYPKAALDYTIYKPIGIYAFKRDILRTYKDLPMGPLEKAEEIELLRLLENGYKIKVKEIASETIAVDTPKDLERVIHILEQRREFT